MSQFSLKDAVKWLVPYNVYVYASRQKGADPAGRYYRGSRLPFSAGYLEARTELVCRGIDSPSVFDRFVRNEPLPDKYGVLFDERVVEYPWIFANLNRSQGVKFLDVGPALNHRFCVEYLKRPDPQKHITMLSLTPEENCYYHNGVSYVLQDVRRLSFKDETFDEITCISTLEHIGMDNSKYRGPNESNVEDYKVALLELKRVLRSGGTLLITVPFGPYAIDQRGSQQRFNKEMVDECVRLFGPSDLKQAFYKYSAAGWNLSTAASCETAEYTSRVLNDVREYENHPVCAGAIACMKFTK